MFSNLIHRVEKKHKEGFLSIRKKGYGDAHHTDLLTVQPEGSKYLWGVVVWGRMLTAVLRRAKGRLQSSHTLSTDIAKHV